MKSIKGTQTEKNLLSSFAGESQAILRYTIWGKMAIKQGYQQISDVFMITTHNEQAHAKLFFQNLVGGELPVGGLYPAGVMSTIDANLAEAADNEHAEHTTIYPAFAKKAEEEGFPELADLWADICVAEAEHEARFRGFLEDVKAGRVFKRDKPVRWMCRNCGFVFEGNEAPDPCPCCKHPKAYFEVLVPQW